MNESIEQNNFSKKEASDMIAFIIQQASQMGANDFEPSALRNIQNQLNEDVIPPNDAVQRAQKILASKNSYH